MAMEVKKRNLLLLTLRDASDPTIYQNFIVETEVDKETLSKKIVELIEKWFFEGREYWTFEQVLKTLEEEKLVTLIPFDEYEIRL